MERLNHFKSGVRYRLLSTAVSCLMAITAFAQKDATNAFNQGIQNATDTIAGTFDTVCTLMLVIGAIVGAVGGVRIYIKWNNGDQDVTKAIVGWGGSCLFLVGTGAILRAIFL